MIENNYRSYHAYDLLKTKRKLSIKTSKLIWENVNIAIEMRDGFNIRIQNVRKNITTGN